MKGALDFKKQAKISKLEQLRQTILHYEAGTLSFFFKKKA